MCCRRSIPDTAPIEVVSSRPPPTQVASKPPSAYPFSLSPPVARDPEDTSSVRTPAASERYSASLSRCIAVYGTVSADSEHWLACFEESGVVHDGFRHERSRLRHEGQQAAGRLCDYTQMPPFPSSSQQNWQPAALHPGLTHPPLPHFGSGAPQPQSQNMSVLKNSSQIHTPVPGSSPPVPPLPQAVSSEPL